MAKPALGRGLGALLGGSPVAKPPPPLATPTDTRAPSPLTEITSADRVRHVPLDEVRPCPFQPRKDFTQEALAELADSIREQGIVQPLIVRAKGSHYELIAGERRWRAAQLAGLKEVPVIVREADDATLLQLALIENLQRENLNPMEEATGYSQLIGQFGLTQEEAAVRVGKSRTVVTNALRLLKLPDAVQAYLRDGRLSVGHAKVILSLFESGKQQLAADRILKDGLNVRQAESLVSVLLNGRPAASAAGKRPDKAPADPHVTRLQDKLRERLGTKVQLRYSDGKGALEISFFSDDELERILGLLGIPAD